ncbi:hypothetical protein [Streptomyces xantholiticus]|uniref:Uncharacterized protein n=1 Tax=Streptomyces xantholiticus TaxID=68285 RepID=A0ABV1UUP9_9ACTN
MDGTVDNGTAWTVLADDPLTTAATDLPELPVLLTVLDGRPTRRDASL